MYILFGVLPEKEDRALFFDLSYKDAAKAVVGRTLVAGSRQAVILETQGFSRASNDAPLYKPMLELRPGDVFTPRQRNAILTLIVCMDGGQSGGCVILRSIEINGGIITGPGRVSEALGMTIPKDPGRVEEHDDGTLELKMARLGPAKMPKPVRERRGNGIGDAVLTRQMPSIVKRFLHLSAEKRGTFESYLNTLLDGCHDESELRRRMRA
jgi:hypothetical protein